MSEIQQVAPILTVIEDGGEYVIQASKSTGKRLGALILSQLPNAQRVTYVDELGVKVFKSNGKPNPVHPPAPLVASPEDSEVVQECPPPSRKIIQDSAAPPSPEAAEDDYESQLKSQEVAAAEMARMEQFNRQNALPDVAPEVEQPRQTRKRENNPEPTGSVCGRCAGIGVVTGEGGFSGVCPVCKGHKVISAWGRRRIKPAAR